MLDYEDEGLKDDPFNPGQQKQRIKLIYELEGGSRQYQWLNASAHPSSKLYEVATSLLNALPGDEIEVDDLVGKRCWVTIAYRTTAEGKKFANIVETRPLLAENGAPRFDTSKKAPPTSVKTSWPAARNSKVRTPPAESNRYGPITDDDVPF